MVLCESAGSVKDPKVGGQWLSRLFWVVFERLCSD